VQRILLVMAVALVMASMLVAMTAPAFAKITEVDVSCENRGGQEPGGQQPSCQNEQGLTQESENQNPSGAAPPGHNK
jgi:hypothetical protein